MLTSQQAREAVTTELRSRCNIPDDKFVIVDNLTIERPFGWIFFYNSDRYLRTKDIMDAIAGNGPIVVEKESGEIKFFGASEPVEALIAKYEDSL
jgi:hypothetical protein